MTVSEKIKGVNNLTKLGISGGAKLGLSYNQTLKAIDKYFK